MKRPVCETCGWSGFAHRNSVLAEGEGALHECDMWPLGFDELHPDAWAVGA